MYKERKENFSVKEVVLQISFVVLFVFLLVWLFPTKGYIDSATKNVKTVTTDNFVENLSMMKEAAQTYFTTPRLPAKVGDKKTITLGEMVESKLLLAFADVNGKTCDLTKSYVEVTKMNDEYVMKVNLKCDSQTDYILVHMGCYSYCPTAMCEKQTPVTPTVNKKYQYEYKLTTAGSWTDWSAFSAWSLTKQTVSDSLKEETKTESVLDHYDSVQVQVGTKTESVFDHYDSVQVQVGTKTESVFDHYESVQVQVGTKLVGTGTYTRGAYVGRNEYTSPKSNTSTYEYVYVATRKELSCTTTCSYVNIYSYDVYKRTEIMTSVPVYETQQKAVYKTVTVPVYETQQKAVYKNVTVPVYETQQKAVYKNVTYYRYQTRTYKPGATTIKWSSTKTDSSLLKQGYKLTGKSRLV